MRNLHVTLSLLPLPDNGLSPFHLSAPIPFLYVPVFQPTQVPYSKPSLKQKFDPQVVQLAYLQVAAIAMVTAINMQLGTLFKIYSSIIKGKD